MQDDVFFMKQALIEAQNAFEQGEIPVGAVVVSAGQIISRSYNLTQTLNDVTAHAEMQAITSAATFLGSKYLTDCTIYITVEPCPMCAAALGWSQIERIVYGTPDKKMGYTTISEKLLHPKTKVTAGVLEDDCAELMQRFFQKIRHKNSL